jgi:hypothetical protein
LNVPVRGKQARPKPASGFDKGALFRLSRMLHAYLSAFAFLALMFFSATGVLLNHPEWFETYRPAERHADFTLSPAELAAAKASKDPGRSLAVASASKTRLNGAYASGDVDGRQMLVRLEGPKGSSDLTIDLTTGKVDARITQTNLMSIVQDLHRGKNVGAVWRWVIDLSAWVIMALALIGYILFFSLRFRLKTSLILTAVSLVALIGLAWAFVP